MLRVLLASLLISLLNAAPAVAGEVQEAALDAAEGAIKQEAAEAWAALADRGDGASDKMLEEFLERYRAAEVSHTEGDQVWTRAVTVPEVQQAAAVLEERYDTGGRTGVSSEELTDLLVSSRGVKSCWVLYQQETGETPSGRMLMSITIQPDGRPSEAVMTSGSYRGTSLDRCLSVAIRRTKFSPFEGMAMTVEYPFVL